MPTWWFSLLQVTWGLERLHCAWAQGDKSKGFWSRTRLNWCVYSIKLHLGKGMNSLPQSLSANQSIPSRSFELAAKYCFIWKISLVFKKETQTQLFFFAFCKNYAWSEPVDTVKCWIYLSRSAYVNRRLWQEQKFMLPSPINQRISSTVVRDFIFPMSEELIFWTCKSRNNSTTTFESWYLSLFHFDTLIFLKSPFCSIRDRVVVQLLLVKWGTLIGC